MSNPKQVNVAIVGLGFGEHFLPIYADHPNVSDVGIVDISADRLRDVGDRYGVAARYPQFEDMLADDHWDAVHVLAPVAFHAPFARAVLQAGKHCACAVPMATELDDLREIVALQRATGKNYMMMETTVFGREYLVVEQMYRRGELGDLTLYRGYHIQNLDGFPEYWRGYPPMKYVTHALAPLLALTGSAVSEVTASGTGRLTDDRRGSFDNPFPAEVGLFQLADADVVADVTMSFFQTARSYVEGFSVYGDRKSIEWSGRDGEPLRVFELEAFDAARRETGLGGRHSSVISLDPPDFAERLPKELTRFVREFTVPGRDGGERTVRAGHGGSHPYLVHEFVSSVVEGRPPRIDAVTSARWTAPGICAHESALSGGKPVEVPTF